MVEQQWFDALAVGAPLATWERALDLSPASIVAAAGSRRRELIRLWSRAAAAQANVEWANALFTESLDPELVPLVGDAAATAFANALTKTRDRPEYAPLLKAIPGPWPPQLGESIVTWLRRLDDNARAAYMLEDIQTAAVMHMADETIDPLDRWLQKLKDDSYPRQVVGLLIQQLSFRTTIIEAFS